MHEKQRSSDQDPATAAQPCATCGGTGHVNLFRGESRFLLSVEECLLCNGTGIEPLMSDLPKK
ncbi:MAG: hypothetical protein CSA34_04080 [Desulfobulbus propionicus]|nr:MAG: hypothetical protein CSA34_04080 [Desulfobulbus propionicus]